MSQSRLPRAVASSVLLVLIASCSQPSSMDALLQDKVDSLQDAQNAMLNESAAFLESMRADSEIDELTNEKLRRLETGQSFDDLKPRDEAVRAKLARRRAGTDQLYLDVVDKLTDLYGLIGAIYTHCGQDIAPLVEAMNLKPLEDALPEDVNPQTMFWNRKFEYGAVVESHAEEFSCDEKVVQIGHMIEMANSG